MTSQEATRARRGSGVLLPAVVYLSVAVFSGLGLLGRAQLVQRIVPVPGPLLYLVVFLWVLLPLAWVLALRLRYVLAPLVLLGVVVASLFAYPKMQDLKRTAHRGTDQPDCVITAAQGMAMAEWPYDTAKLWDHYPMSCGPGWVALQTPAIIALGYRWNLLLVWGLSLALLWYGLRTGPTAGLLALVGLSTITWVAASDGTDFLPYGILLSALFVVLQRPSKLTVPLLVLLALTVQFRFPMLILPILLLPSRQIVQGLLASLAAFACHLGFLLWRPEQYIVEGPLHLFYKLTHAHVIGSGRLTASLELSLVSFGMIGAALLLRRWIESRWLGLAYLLALTLGPAILDLVAKIKQFGSPMAGLGIWEGANWISGCLPMAALFLLWRADSLTFASAESGVRDGVALAQVPSPATHQVVAI